MAEQSMTLAQVFLGLGGQTAYTVGTACTSIGVIFGINRITNLAVKFFSSMSIYLGVDAPKPEDKAVVLTRKDVYDQVTSYGKIIVLILFGIGIKILGSRMKADSTIDAFNRLLYKSS